MLIALCMYLVHFHFWHCWLGTGKDIWPVKNLCLMSPTVLFWRKWRKKSEKEPDKPGLPGKWPSKMEKVVVVSGVLCHCIIWHCLVVWIWFMSHPAWGRGTPFPPLLFLVHSLPHLLLFITFSLFSFLIHFTYFLLLSIRSLSTGIVPLRFQAWGCRRRSNLGLVCFALWLCYLYCLV